jgi:hypothetical protein
MHKIIYSNSMYCVQNSMCITDFSMNLNKFLWFINNNYYFFALLENHIIYVC